MVVGLGDPPAILIDFSDDVELLLFEHALEALVNLHFGDLLGSDHEPGVAEDFVKPTVRHSLALLLAFGILQLLTPRSLTL